VAGEGIEDVVCGGVFQVSGIGYDGRIGLNPGFSVMGQLARKMGELDVYPLNAENSHFFFSARYALSGAIRALGMGAGDRVLIPSYSCGTEVDPFLDQQVGIRFYRIRRDMSIDMEDLIERIDNTTRAILVTHYIGFPQPIGAVKRICAEQGLLLIEDCAHAFLSEVDGSSVGTFGDASIFSLRKTLPIPNGGVLVVNNPGFECKEELVRPWTLSISSCLMAMELLKEKTGKGSGRGSSYLRRARRNALSAVENLLRLTARVGRKFSPRRVGPALVHPNSYEFRGEMRTWAISRLAWRIMNRTEYRGIREARRRNYEHLSGMVSGTDGAVPVFKDLPPGVCPLFFPLVVKGRDEVVDRLRARGVKSYAWWRFMHDAVPWREFPDAAFLKRHILGLPVHQDLDTDHMERIGRGVREILESKSLEQ